MHFKNEEESDKHDQMTGALLNVIFVLWHLRADGMCVLFPRGLSAPEAELLYMQEVEKIEGYGEESVQAKVNRQIRAHICSKPLTGKYIVCLVIDSLDIFCIMQYKCCQTLIKEMNAYT